MPDFEVLRRRMVEEQLVLRGIQDAAVLRAFRGVERHKFVPEGSRGSAYADFPVSIGEGQTISQPYIVALMSEALKLTGKERVLEVGTGSGYQAAILAELAKEVYSVERFAVLAERAAGVLEALGYRNIRIRVGDGTEGWPEEAPFDRVIITAAAQRVPEPLFQQLAEDGLLIAPVGENFSQVLTLFTKKKGKLESKQLCGCVFVPLIGKYA